MKLKLQTKEEKILFLHIFIFIDTEFTSHTRNSMRSHFRAHNVIFVDRSIHAANLGERRKLIFPLLFIAQIERCNQFEYMRNCSTVEWISASACDGMTATWTIFPVNMQRETFKRFNLVFRQIVFRRPFSYIHFLNLPPLARSNLCAESHCSACLSFSLNRALLGWTAECN